MYKRILVPLDGSDIAEQAMPYAQLLTRGLKANIELLRVYSTPPAELSDPARGVYLSQICETFKNMAEDYLGEQAAILRKEGLSVATVVLEGDAAGHIVSEAEKEPDTLIVICSHGRSGITRWVMGSVTDKVLRATSAPMLIIRPKADGTLVQNLELKDIIVPLDGSPLGEEVLSHAVNLSKEFGLGVTLLRAIPSAAEYFSYMDYPIPNYDELYQQVEEDAKQYLEETRQRISQQGTPRVEARLILGNAAGAITDYARDVPNSIIAMTTHGRSGVGRWVLGSVADRVVRHSGNPVLLVRAKDTDDG